jgi:hypothetical protein
VTDYVTGDLLDGADELLATAQESIPVAQRLGIRDSTCTAPAWTAEDFRCVRSRRVTRRCPRRPMSSVILAGDLGISALACYRRASQ